MRKYLVLLALFVVAIAMAACGGSSSSPAASDTSAGSAATSGGSTLGTVVSPAQDASIRLEWVKQTQFAGFLVADHFGWYKAAGVNVTLKPAGPSLFPAQQVAIGNDQFGVLTPLSTVGALDNGAPLVTVMQYHQDSPSAYVALKSSGIKTVADMKGKRVGTWFGGNEFQIIAMLKAAGLSKSDVTLVSQGFTVVPFLQGQYDVSQVTVYNELGLIEDKIGADKLNIIRPSDSGVAAIGNGVITTQSYMAAHPDVVQVVVEQSIRGWQWAIQHPEEAAKIAVEANPDLTLDHQIFMMKENAKLVCTGATLDPTKGIGWVDPAKFDIASKILLDSGQIKAMPDMSKDTTNKFVLATPKEWRTVDCTPYITK